MFARCLSSLKDERVEASKQLKGPAVTKYSGNKEEFVEHVRKVSLALNKVLLTRLCTVQLHFTIQYHIHIAVQHNINPDSRLLL